MTAANKSTYQLPFLLLMLILSSLKLLLIAVIVFGIGFGTLRRGLWRVASIYGGL